MSIFDYGLGLHLKGEKERWISIDKAECGLGRILYIGHGGFFGDLSTKNAEVRRVERYLRRLFK